MFGKMMRVVKEGVQEKLPGSKNDGFETTPTDRLTGLIDQLAPVEVELRKYLKDLSEFKIRAQDFLGSSRNVLFIPPGSADSSSNQTPALGHLAVNSSTPSNINTSRLDSATIQPVERWLEEYRLVKSERLTMVEKVRLELDSRRRQEVELREGVAKLQGQTPPTDESKLQKHTSAIEAAVQRLTHKQNKLDGCARAHELQESAVHDHLAALAADTELLPTYLAGALGAFRDMFDESARQYPEHIRSAPATSALESGAHNTKWEQIQREIDAIRIPPASDTQSVGVNRMPGMTEATAYHTTAPTSATTTYGQGTHQPSPLGGAAHNTQYQTLDNAQYGQEQTYNPHNPAVHNPTGPFVDASYNPSNPAVHHGTAAYGGDTYSSAAPPPIHTSGAHPPSSGAYNRDTFDSTIPPPSAHNATGPFIGDTYKTPAIGAHGPIDPNGAPFYDGGLPRDDENFKTRAPGTRSALGAGGIQDGNQVNFNKDPVVVDMRTPTPTVTRPYSDAPIS